MTDLAAEAEFRVFQEAASSGERVRGFNAKGAADRYSRKTIDELTAFIVEDFGAPGAGLVQGRCGRQARLAHRQEFQRSPARADRPSHGGRAGRLPRLRGRSLRGHLQGVYALRKRLAAELKLFDPGQMHFSWVVEFPMFAADQEEGGWAAMHHPFTAPRPQDRRLLGQRSGPAAAPRPTTW